MTNSQSQALAENNSKLITPNSCSGKRQSRLPNSHRHRPGYKGFTCNVPCKGNSKIQPINSVNLMTSEERQQQINTLVERLRELDLKKRAMDLVLQDFIEQRKKDAERLSKLDEMLSRVESLKTSIQEETKKRKAAERKAADLEAKLKRTGLNK